MDQAPPASQTGYPRCGHPYPVKPKLSRTQQVPDPEEMGSQGLPEASHLSSFKENGPSCAMTTSSGEALRPPGSCEARALNVS